MLISTRFLLGINSSNSDNVTNSLESTLLVLGQQNTFIVAKINWLSSVKLVVLKL